MLTGHADAELHLIVPRGHDGGHVLGLRGGGCRVFAGPKLMSLRRGIRIGLFLARLFIEGPGRSTLPGTTGITSSASR